jgi:hypothetical protein
MTIATTLLALAAFGAAGTAHALDIPLACDDVAGAHQRCALATTELAPQQDFEAELRISYDFPCHGHAIGAVIRAGDSSAPLQFGGTGATPLILTGAGPFVVTDDDPQRTYRATLVGACVIHVTALDLRPSALQLAMWKQQASDLARLIDAELGELKLTKSLQAVIGWDDDQLAATQASVDQQLAAALPAGLTYADLVYPTPCATPSLCGKLKNAADMPPAWTLAVVTDPNLPDLVALKAQITSIKAGRPAAYGPGDVATLTTALGNDGAAAATLIANGDRWIQIIDTAMQQLVARLKVLQQEAAQA